MCWTMKPQFQGILAQAANLGQSVGNYTAEQFKAEYPQFCDADGNCHLPDAMLEEIVKMANISIQPSGALVGVVKSATLGDSSVTYDTSALTAGTEDWGDLNATTYGQMLANRARFIGAAGTFVM